MAQIFRKEHNIVPAKSAHSRSEFGAGKKGLTLCNDCGAAYYKKSWHHAMDGFKSIDRKDVAVVFETCPACAMIRNKQYEGRVTIAGCPSAKRAELLAMIERFGKYWNAKDVLDRIIETKNEGGNLVVTTTENQLAAKLGRKIKDVFPGVKTNVAYRGDPSDVVDVTVTFPAK